MKQKWYIINCNALEIRKKYRGKCIFCGRLTRKPEKLFGRSEWSEWDNLLPVEPPAGGSAGEPNIVATCDLCKALKGLWADLDFPRIETAPDGRFISDANKPPYVLKAIEYLIQEAEKYFQQIKCARKMSAYMIACTRNHLRLLEIRRRQLMRQILTANEKQHALGIDDD